MGSWVHDIWLVTDYLGSWSLRALNRGILHRKPLNGFRLVRSCRGDSGLLDSGFVFDRGQNVVAFGVLEFRVFWCRGVL